MKEMIKSYVKHLTKENLETFAKKNNIVYTKEELNIVYSFIQNHYEDLLEEKIEVFQVLKQKISPNLYKTLLSLYIEYKQKYL